MKRRSLLANIRKAWRDGLRKAFSLFPQSVRFAIFRSFVECDPAPDKRLVLKIAETREELEECFKLLHDAYVSSGFMKPAPSGLRATIYHALPTTTTLCAKFDGQVVGTLSLIRESVFGFPLQAIFDLKAVRARGGKIAEVSALAVHPDFRKTGGAILFPLMKFMYEYCTTFFDTRHLVIAVNPNRIEMYESLLLFKRLSESKVDNYDFANGAPAVGATLDLRSAPRKYKDLYDKKPRRKNLYDYFVRTELPNIQLPQRRYHTTNDPVMTTELLDYFFNQRTQVFEHLSNREKMLLHAIYDLPEHQKMLPKMTEPPRSGKHPSTSGIRSSARATFWYRPTMAKPLWPACAWSSCRYSASWRTPTPNCRSGSGATPQSNWATTSNQQCARWRCAAKPLGTRSSMVSPWPSPIWRGVNSSAP